MFKTGDLIYKFILKIDYKEDKTTFTCSELKVLDSNEKIFVLKDNDFTRIQYKQEKSYNPHSCFKIVSIHHHNFQPYFDYVQAQVYTQFPSKKIAFKNIKKKLELWIYKEYGRYCKGIELLNSFEI